MSYLRELSDNVNFNKEKENEKQIKLEFEKLVNHIENESKNLEKYAKKGDYYVNIAHVNCSRNYCDKVKEFIKEKNKSKEYIAPLKYEINKENYYVNMTYIKYKTMKIRFDWSDNGFLTYLTRFRISGYD